MKERRMNLLKVLVLVSVFMTAVFSAVILASAKPTISSEEETVLVCTNHSFSTDIFSKRGGKIISVKSSKPNVVVINKESITQNAFGWQAIGKGTAVITVKYKEGTKTYTLKQKITVKKETLFKYLKYGGKEIYKGHEFESNFVTPKKGKTLAWKLKSGYKLVSATYAYQNLWEPKPLKNNKTKITVKKNDALFATFEVKNPQGLVFEYRVVFMK